MEDLSGLTELKKLKELHIAPTEGDNRETVLEKAIVLESLFPGCAIYVDHQLM
jgi:hypothetical protein